jgi:hypothetical protein
MLLAAVPVWAHHAFAADFDEKKPLKLQGIVTKWELVNPHSWIWIRRAPSQKKRVASSF